nr:MAG TPA: hypothetical protein [Caudoviricetes sp.]
MEVTLKAGDSLNIPEGCKAVIKDNVVVFDSVFQDGDILAHARCLNYSCPFIYKGTDESGFYQFYVGVNNGGEICQSNDTDKRWGNGALRHATEEEKQLLFDKMKEGGLRWNAEEKRVEKIRWRAEDGKEYYYVDNQEIIIVDKEDGHWADENRYRIGNYFHTREQAEEAARRVKETLRKYHEEIGE